MRGELQTKLIEKYPSLFKYLINYRSVDLISPICFGIETGDGWYDLLDELFGKMVELDHAVSLMQVKEKFGELRVYVGPSTDVVFDLIDEYTERSRSICEVCGKEGKLRGKIWLTTRCDECYEKETSGGYFFNEELDEKDI